MDKYRKRVYCSVQFLREYIAVLEDKSYSFSDYQTMKLWACLKSLLFSSNIDLYCDMSREDIESMADEVYKRRQKNARKGRVTILSMWEKIVSSIDFLQRENKLHIHYVGKNMQEYIKERNEDDSWDKTGLYILCDVLPSCIENAKANGILPVTPDNMGDFIPLLNDMGQAIKNNESGTWCNILQGKMLPCNSMIIVDNYVLNKMDTYENNITPIFDSILPKNLTKGASFHLTIITKCKESDKPSANYLPLESRFDKIIEILTRIRPELKVELSIARCTDEFHDRTIVTNNMWISSGGGFDLYKKDNRTSKATLINIVNPYLNDTICWGETAYMNLMNDIKEVFDKLQNENKNIPYYYIGSGKNRLIN